MLAHSTGGAMVKAGGDSWFLIVADYAFGHALERDTSEFVRQAGGKVLGAVALSVSQHHRFLLVPAAGAILRRQGAGAGNAGTDGINLIKQAHEFGIPMRIAGLLVFLTDVHSIGLDVAQGLALTASYYWDLNPGTRRFADKFTKRQPGKRPTMVHAGVYSSGLHYLKVAAEMGVAQAKADGAATVARMKATPTDDDCFGRGSIRVDGRKLCPSYLFEVKKPSESKGPWDYYKLLATTPADEAFRPLAAGGCPLVKG